MITIKRGSIQYNNSVVAWNKCRDFTNPANLYVNWIKQYGGCIVNSWDIKFENNEDAAVFILKYS